MEMKDLMISDSMYKLLFINGQDDRRRGIDMNKGWEEICAGTGFTNERTPAREAYEDGYYTPTTAN